MKIGSLCTGYGGLDMAVESFFNAETIWTCEFDKYASQVIEKQIGKINHGDLKKTDWTQVESIDILTAGYPCQPFSNAGSRKGADDERHLWPYIKEIISILQPEFVVLENVRGHLGLGFREVLADLAEIRYDAIWQIVRASDVGAPHRRERLFVLAYADSSRRRVPLSNETITNSNGSRLQRSIGTRYGSEQSSETVANTNSHARTQSRRATGELRAESAGLRAGQNQGQAGQKHGSGSQIVPNANNAGRFGTMPRSQSRYDSRSTMHLQEVPTPLDQGKLNAKFVEYMMGLPNGWVTDVGLSRSQQLKILGNGVVPQQAEYALELLWDIYVNK